MIEYRALRVTKATVFMLVASERDHPINAIPVLRLDVEDKDIAAVHFWPKDWGIEWRGVFLTKGVGDNEEDYKDSFPPGSEESGL